MCFKMATNLVVLSSSLLIVQLLIVPVLMEGTVIRRKSKFSGFINLGFQSSSKYDLYGLKPIFRPFDNANAEVRRIQSIVATGAKSSEFRGGRVAPTTTRRPSKRKVSNAVKVAGAVQGTSKPFQGFIEKGVDILNELGVGRSLDKWAQAQNITPGPIPNTPPVNNVGTDPGLQCYDCSFDDGDCVDLNANREEFPKGTKFKVLCTSLLQEPARFCSKMKLKSGRVQRKCIIELPPGYGPGCSPATENYVGRSYPGEFCVCTNTAGQNAGIPCNSATSVILTSKYAATAIVSLVVLNPFLIQLLFI